MSVENRKRKKKSKIKGEDSTLLCDKAGDSDGENESTRRFNDEKLTTTLFPSEEKSTERFTERERLQETFESEVAVTSQRDENTLQPSRLRFAFICLLFVVAGISIAVNAYLLFLQTSMLPEWAWQWNGERFVIASVRANFGNIPQPGDEILSVNGVPLVERYKYSLVFGRLTPGEKYTVEFKRGEETQKIEFSAEPLTTAMRINLVHLGIISKTVILLTAIFIFLLKPNNRLILLIAISVTLVSLVIDPPGRSSYEDAHLFFIVVWQIGVVIGMLYPPFLLHFFLLFPRPLPLVRRYPQIFFLIYLPYLLYIFPTSVGWRLSYAGFSQFDFLVDSFWLTLDDYIAAFYLLSILLILIFNYRRANEIDKRRLRIFFVSVGIAALPSVIYELILLPIELNTGYLFFPSLATQELFMASAVMFAPPIFAYAVVRHKVIPVSLVIRRGLQYLLATNALRLMLILPILGVVWNITANPNRTLSEIFLNNSLLFYFCGAFAVALVLLNRFGLREWVDKKFFREQYNQDKILRELTEAVKESDSLVKLSRLVSSKIQLALHPTSIYLFFRDDEMNSEFSLGYTTSEASENSANLKLAADSPLLSFMQQERGAIEFQTRRADDLPPREKRWLHEIKADLLIPMHGTDGKLGGFFALGEKLSQIPYTKRDKEMLETLANQIALAQENLYLKDRVRREQKIKTEVLARFDEGNINLLKECPRCGRCFDRKVSTCNADGANLTFTLPVERTIENRYRLEKLIGKGGMGAVYEAVDTRINRHVAVKILSGAMLNNRDALRRFEREAQTAGRLQHENIVTIFDYGVLSTQGAFLVMELVPGESLRRILRREGKLDTESVKDWFGQILDGVATAHKHKIIHRDLKPDNILVLNTETRRVRLCILDFGLARGSEQISEGFTVPGTIMGTFGYMPPEQMRGEKTDERSDLYAVGVMIYEALHGEKPFRGKNYHELLLAMVDQTIANHPFFKQSLAPESNRRFGSAEEMKLHLLQLEI